MHNINQDHTLHVERHVAAGDHVVVHVCVIRIDVGGRPAVVPHRHLVKVFDGTSTGVRLKDPAPPEGIPFPDPTETFTTSTPTGKTAFPLAGSVSDVEAYLISLGLLPDEE